MNIGLLALQGGYSAHAAVLKKLNVETTWVRNLQDLTGTEGLIIPGGESSVLIKLLQANGLWEALIDYKKPLFGTCAGAILLAKQVLYPSQANLKHMDITLARNAYGRQLASQVKLGHCLLSQKEIEMVFIRAPKIIAITEKNVNILAKYADQPVAVEQANCIAATFHPELSQDYSLHTYFIEKIKNQLRSALA